MFGDMHGRPHRSQAAAGPVSADALLLAACDDCALSREADHRIANHLAILASFVRLKTSEFARDSGARGSAAMLLLANIELQIKGMAQLHRSFCPRWRPGPGQCRRLPAPDLQPVGGRRARSGYADRRPGADCRADLAQVLALGQIVAEIVTNAIKHGRRDDGSCRIGVRAGQNAAGAITVDVVDDGPGFMSGQDGAGLGFRLMRALSWASRRRGDGRLQCAGA